MNIRSLYSADSLKTVASELAKCKIQWQYKKSDEMRVVVSQ